MQNIKIGVAIPIYNVGEYLKQCLDSVKNQTYKNFHCVLIDDGSSDESLNIAAQFVAQDSRFTLIAKENGGQSSARNVGIEYFCGNLKFNDMQDSKAREILRKFSESKFSDSDFSQLRDSEVSISKSKLSESEVSQSCNSESSTLKSDISEVNPLESNTSVSKFSKSKLNIYEIEILNNPPCLNSRNPLNDNFKNLPSPGKLLYALNGGGGHNSLNDENLESNPLESTLSHSNTPNSQIDYLIFLDPDDFWTNDCLEQCVNALFNPPPKLDSDLDSEISESKMPDIVWFKSQPLYDGAKPNATYDRNGQIVLATHFFDLYNIHTPTLLSTKQWLKIHRTSGQLGFSWVVMGIVNFSIFQKGLRFSNGLIYEDNLFAIKLFLQAKGIAILPTPLYVWRVRLHSTMRQYESKNKAAHKNASPYIKAIYSLFKSRDIMKLKELYSCSCFGIMFYELIGFLDKFNCDNETKDLIYKTIIRQYLSKMILLVCTNDDAFGVKNKLEIFQPYIKYGSFETRLAFNNPRIYRLIVLPLFTFLRQAGLVRLAKKIRFKLGL